MNDFKVGDFIEHIAGQQRGTVTDINPQEKEMTVLFLGDSIGTLCINSTEFFALIKGAPSKEEKAEWASLWDDAADDT